MAMYQVHRLKDGPRQHFRWAPHSSGVTIVKLKDYEKAHAIEGSTPYAAWLAVRETEQALEIGDLLEYDDGQLRIFKYVGFEEARWYVPEPVVHDAAAPVEVT